MPSSSHSHPQSTSSHSHVPRSSSNPINQMTHAKTLAYQSETHQSLDQEIRDLLVDLQDEHDHISE